MKPIDIARAVGAVTREVESREHEGRMARVVIATRTYDTTIEDLWNAVTDAERIPRWFLPISGELRLGGRYQLTGNAGGTITECEPPRHFALTWEFGGGVSWVSVRLSADPKGGTRLELEHLAHVEEHWNKFGPGAVGIGWDLLSLQGLSRHLETGAAVNPEEANGWPASEEGKTFIRLSGEDWCRADIASGADPDAAKAAAARTIAFYTGDAPPGGS
jgi:uncharacterized protein YndB with AHSA1/START domain